MMLTVWTLYSSLNLNFERHTPQYFWKIAGARGPSLLICLPTHPFYGPVGGGVSL